MNKMLKSVSRLQKQLKNCLVKDASEIDDKVDELLDIAKQLDDLGYFRVSQLTNSLVILQKEILILKSHDTHGRTNNIKNFNLKYFTRDDINFYNFNVKSYNRLVSKANKELTKSLENEFGR